MYVSNNMRAYTYVLHVFIQNYNFLTKGKTSYSTPEIKLIILFSYYGITIILVLIRLMVNLLSINPIVDNIFNFTLCSTGGHKEECDRYREELNNDLIIGVVLDLISFFAIALGNIVNLLYVLQYKDVKNVFQKILTITSSEKSEM